MSVHAKEHQANWGKPMSVHARHDLKLPMADRLTGLQAPYVARASCYHPSSNSVCRGTVKSSRHIHEADD